MRTEDVIATGKVDLIKAQKQRLLKRYDAIHKALEELNQAVVAHNPDQDKVTVSSLVVKRRPFKHFIKIQGNVETKQNLVIFSQYSGILDKIYVREGQDVKRGQRLAHIDDGGLAQKLLQARAEAELRATTFERQKRLWAQKIGSEIQYLQAKTRAESARQSVQQLQSQLAKTRIHAPFDGRIEALFSDQGQVVTPGAKIMRLLSLKNMYVEAKIPENYIRDIKRGDHVSVELPAIGKTYEGVIRQVSNYINPNNRSFSIQVDIPNRQGLVKPNLIAQLEINDYTNPSALAIPTNTIRQDASGQKVVYTIENLKDNSGEASKTIITTGRTTAPFTEVLSGLTAGQILVSSGTEDLENGDKVQIKASQSDER